MYKYTHKLLPASFENIFKKLGNFERSLNYQLDILEMCSLQYLPSSSLLKMWNNLPLDLKRSNSLSNLEIQLGLKKKVCLIKSTYSIQTFEPKLKHS